MSNPVIWSKPGLPPGAAVPVPEGADAIESVHEVRGLIKNVTIAVVRVFYNKYLDEVDELPEQVNAGGAVRHQRDGDICWDEREERTDIYATNHQRRYQWTSLVTINTTMKQYYDWVNSWALGSAGAGSTVYGVATAGTATTGTTALGSTALGTLASQAGPVGIAGLGLAVAYLITCAYAHTEKFAAEQEGAGGWYLISDQTVPDSRHLVRTGTATWVQCSPKHPCSGDPTCTSVKAVSVTGPLQEPTPARPPRPQQLTKPKVEVNAYPLPGDPVPPDPHAGRPEKGKIEVNTYPVPGEESGGKNSSSHPQRAGTSRKRARKSLAVAMVATAIIGTAATGVSRLSSRHGPVGAVSEIGFAAVRSSKPPQAAQQKPAAVPGSNTVPASRTSPTGDAPTTTSTLPSPTSSTQVNVRSGKTSPTAVTTGEPTPTSTSSPTPLAGVQATTTTRPSSTTTRPTPSTTILSTTTTSSTTTSTVAGRACAVSQHSSYRASVDTGNPVYTLVQLCDSRTIKSVIMSQGGGSRPIVEVLQPENSAAPSTGLCAVVAPTEVDCTGLNVSPYSIERLRYNDNARVGDLCFLTITFADGTTTEWTGTVQA